MIIDRTRLAGDLAYLTDQGTHNLAQSPIQRGSTQPIVRGMGLDVSGVRLLLRGPDLRKLYARSEQDGRPLLSFTVTKELFPEFFADPYAHRVHSVAGFEDFQRGRFHNLRALEVEGRATLVAQDWGSCSWLSPIYSLPTPTALTAAAWELASARLTPDDGFAYLLRLQIWVSGEDPATDPGSEVAITPSGALARPSDLRHRRDLKLGDVIAYRVAFKAEVRRDTNFLENQFAGDDPQGGRPLLRAVHLLEPVPSPYIFACLHELEGRCSSFSFLEPSLPLTTLSAYLDLPALLVHREVIELAVRPGVWDVVEAHLDGEVRIRPPLVDRVLGE